MQPRKKYGGIHVMSPSKDMDLNGKSSVPSFCSTLVLGKGNIIKQNGLDHKRFALWARSHHC